MTANEIKKKRSRLSPGSFFVFVRRQDESSIISALPYSIRRF
jgi:hypothetical protein